MSRDLYELLGVPENANETWIRRAHQSAQDRIAADESLSEQSRASAQRELENALRTLTSPSAREAYDDKLHRAREKLHASAGGIAGKLASPTVWITLGVVLVLAGAGYWQYQREQERQRVIHEQQAAEQAEKQRLADLEARRIREKKRLEEEIRAQKEAEENQHQLSNEARQADMQKKQFVVDERIPAAQQQSNYFADRVDSSRRQDEEQRQRYEEQTAIQRAKAEVERQKRFLEQREREEQYERASKDSNSRYSRY